MKPSPAPTLSAKEKVTLYRELVRIRRFEAYLLKEYCCGKMGGFLILSAGQEALAVAAKSLMQPDDHLICGVRSLSYALACGVGRNEIMAELYGKTTGCCGGKGGMFGVFAPQHHFHGGYACAGTQTPLGTGLAFALKYQEKNGVALCFLGDGATDQGAFHESLNLASLLKLPIVFIIENNQYSMGTSVARHVAGSRKPLAQRAEGYDMAWDVVEDGSDLIALRDQFHRAMERAREESLPTLLEVKTYRHYGFTIADANTKKYRTPEEIQFHRDHHDCVANWGKVLKEDRLLSDEDIKKISKQAIKEAGAAADFAESAPTPTQQDLTSHVYWELDQEDRTSKGTLLFE